MPGSNPFERLADRVAGAVCCDRDHRSRRSACQVANDPSSRSSVTIAGVVSARVISIAMHLSPLEEECRYHCKREIDDRQNPQTAPVACHLPQASAKLVYAHDTVDRGIG